ncbi:LCP family protein [Mycobacterium sp. Lab-001]|uniref:LCP family protein n=1 Tax=Mycobacterium sp. Lab-001 TaxID=3410136 RepID=UPI003D183DA5
MNGDRSPERPRTSPDTRPEPSPVIRRHPAPSRAAARRGAPRAPAPPVPAPRPETPHRAPRGRAGCRWMRAIALSLPAAVLIAGAGVVGGAAWLDTALHRTPALNAYPDRPGPGRGTNWLLVGSDSRQGLTTAQQRELSTGGDIGTGRTDTILLVHLPALSKPAAATMVSLPRDSYVPIPGHGRDKINAAFSIGGAALLTRTVEQATGLRLDHYAEIGFGGFAALVDALGGVRVCPQAPVDDPLAGIALPAGCQTLDGRGALGYVRTRGTPRADLDRMVNQREFMSSLLRRAADPGVWVNPWRWYSVPHALAGALTVGRDDHVWDLARLGWTLHGHPTTITVPIGRFASAEAGSVVVWDHDAASQLFDALASDAPVPAALDGQP